MRNGITARKQSRVSSRILFTWLVLAGLILLFAPRSITNNFQLAFACIFRQPLTICRNLSFSAQSPLSSDVVSRSKYIKLQNHLANMIAWLDSERQKVEKLSGLRDRPVWKGVNFVLADVITASVGGSRGTVMVNRGQNDGLRKGQFVLGDYSIVGTVSEVDSRTAEVRLITDPTSRIAVQITDSSRFAAYRKTRFQSGTAAIMQGNGDSTAKIRLLPTKYRVETGSVVYAQKKPGFLDTPMILGTVAECKRDDGNPLLWDITVRPACDIERLNAVTVVIMNSGQ
jgi:rod shape-determining protein MreC